MGIMANVSENISYIIDGIEVKILELVIVCSEEVVI